VVSIAASLARDESVRVLDPLVELLARCDPKAPRSKEEREWLNDRSKGGELI